MIEIKTLEDYLKVTKLIHEHVNKLPMPDKTLKSIMGSLEANFSEYLIKDGPMAVYDEETNTLSYREKSPS